ncbi:uncharacterized protein L203_102421 [Cryptococcus depauperatus CBS 7841]|uniref:Uncharacterized protein n=1 Tax=Cryptococcus depauperatus CBS 7841 TaxID=1295531 RepID=A0A1E3IAK2_9TREE|nr:hypothetical protein L203_04880 [Cryptococcus depauperatus CBS 7841]
MSVTLKSALKKPRKSFNIIVSPEAGPSQLKVFSASKAKATVSINEKPQRFSNLRMDNESEGSLSDSNDSHSDEVIDDNEMDTDEEIEKSKEHKTKKSLKRKRAPTTAANFGATLTSLLNDPLKKPSKKIKAPGSSSKATSTPILALSAHKLPTKTSVTLEAKAKKQLKVEKEEKEDRARVKNVVEGWSGDSVVGGQEFERNLRKTAQKGVVKLFNAILVASKTAEAAQTALADKARVRPEAAKKKEKDNILGRGGKEDVLTKESFLEMVRKGSSK